MRALVRAAEAVSQRSLEFRGIAQSAGRRRGRGGPRILDNINPCVNVIYTRIREPCEPHRRVVAEKINDYARVRKNVGSPPISLRPRVECVRARMCGELWPRMHIREPRPFYLPWLNRTTGSTVMYVHSSDTQIASPPPPLLLFLSSRARDGPRILISKLHYYYPLRNAATLDSRRYRVTASHLFPLVRDRRRRDKVSLLATNTP